MEQCCGPLSVEIIPRNHCDFRTYLTKRERPQSGACPEVQFHDYGTEIWSPGSRNGSRKALRFQYLSCQESEISLWRMRRGAISGLWNRAVVPRQQNWFEESTAISAPILPRERELSKAHAQRSSFLIMEQRCGPLAVEMIPGKHCDFSTYIATKERTQSGACPEVQFPDYGTVLWSPGSRNGSRKAGKHCDFRSYLTKRTRAQFGACAEVQFPDYGTVMWAHGCRNNSRKALRFQHLTCQECESSVWRMRRGAVS
jgi:hypothetical protein